jgi:hypothetical protein
MVSVIQKAQGELKPHYVDEHGYLILEKAPYYESLTELWRACKVPRPSGRVQGFKLKADPSGHMNAYVDHSASFDLSTMLESESTLAPSLDPERDFQHWITSPPDTVKYLMCDPLRDHPINDILDARFTFKRRPPIPGVNLPYWYVSASDVHG